ncbi:7TM diverse intracellular signaling domain-containing protein [Pedobacter sp. AW1-32]|uniref:7TM diverse intracellular signaling domain-containing protein n=1 Tax=Pedobacter sp. AW1-32 TaxID=3383026 RepID=UPI003FEDD04F
MRIILFFIALCAGNFLSNAQPIIRVDKSNYKNVANKAFFWKDKRKNASFDQLVTFPADSFQLGRSEIFNGGIVGDVWWMKLRFQQPAEVIPILLIDYTNIDTIDVFYTSKAGKTVHIQSGMYASDANTLGPSTGYSFGLGNVIENDGVHEVYVRLRAVNTLIVPVKLLTGRNLNNRVLKDNTPQLIFVGITFMMLIFHLLMWIFTRSRLFGFYIGRIILLYYIGMVLYLQGFGLLLGQDIGRFILRYAHSFLSLGFISSILFSNHFLKVHRHLKNVYLVSKILIGFWSLVLIMSIAFNLSFTNQATLGLSFLTSVLIFYSSFKIIISLGYGKRVPGIRLFVIGWIPVAVLSIYIVCCLQNWLNLEDHSFDLLTIACLIEGAIISIGLFGQRLRLLTRHNAHVRHQGKMFFDQAKSYQEELSKKQVVSRSSGLKDLVQLAHEADPSFMTRFSEVENDFMQEILSRDPGLLQPERELCAYMRLGFETKEIARVTKLSVRAVESRKYRVRKKLGLSSDTNMYLWILELAKDIKSDSPK